MDRRAALKGMAGSVAAAYVWIPKIAIAQAKGDPRDAIIKSRKTIENNFACLERGDSTRVAAVTKKKQSGYRSGEKIARKTLARNSYQKFQSSESKLSYSDEGDRALCGGYRDDEVNFCGTYFDDNLEPLAYITNISYMSHSFIIEKASANLSQSSLIDALYPAASVQDFRAAFGDDRGAVTPVRMVCGTSIVTFTYTKEDKYSGHGRVGVYDRKNIRKTVYEETFEYAFSV